MINNTILEYVRAERLRGVADADIRTALLANTWKPEDVEDSFSALDSGMTPSVGAGKVSPSFSLAYLASLVDGRIGRWHYFFWSLLVFLVGVAFLVTLFFGIMGAFSAFSPGEEGMSWFAFLGLILVALIFLFIPITIANTTLAIRRLHDLDHSGWWVLISFVPYISFVLMIYLVFFRGTAGTNRFGSPEVYPRTLSGVWSAAWRM